jgi:hypothetical protein
MPVKGPESKEVDQAPIGFLNVSALNGKQRRHGFCKTSRHKGTMLIFLK